MDLRRLLLVLALPCVASTAHAEVAPPPSDSAPPVASASPSPAPVLVAPANVADDPPVRLRPDMEVFAQYAYRHTNDLPSGSHWFHDFDVPRVHLGLTGDQGGARGRVLIEGVRSSSEGALTGVAGDSVVLRVREAWAGYHEAWFEARAGVVPTATIPLLDDAWRTRAVAASPLETAGLLSPADVGAMARAELPLHYGHVSLAAYNGEGYTNRELNRGKNEEVAAVVRPLAGTVAEPLAVVGSYVLGSSGTGRAKANRLTLGILWTGEHVRAGVDLTLAAGVADASSRNAMVADAFVRVEPVGKLILAARGGLLRRDTSVAEDRILTLWGAVGYEIAKSLETFLAVTRAVPGHVAREAIAGSDYVELRAIARVHF